MRANAMAFSLVWALSATRDGDRIVEYLLYDLGSPQAVRHFLDALDRALGKACDEPSLYPISREPRLV